MSDYSELPNFLTVDEARAILRIGRSGFYELIYEKKVPAIKVRGQWRIPKQQLLDRLDQWASE